MNTAPEQSSFWNEQAAIWLQRLGSSREGLSAAEALRRRSGITGKQSALLKDAKLFVRQLSNPLMLLLLGAVVLSNLLGDSPDSLIILLIVGSSALLSFIQERNAGKVVARLQEMLAVQCTVVREGVSQEVPLKQVVPGDVLQLKAGDMIPGDCIILEANELHANESSLTGESYPVRKEPGVIPASTVLSKRTNCLWEGTSIVSGHATALVVYTDKQTVFGQIATAANRSGETSFEKGIRDFGMMLMKITLVLAVAILIMNLLTGKSVFDAALFALALAVGMAPELLPAITTIAMSAGAKRLLQKKVLVRRLNAIQNLGEVSLLCTDKTGTITEGAIQVTGCVDVTGAESNYVKQLAWWNATLETGYVNPIDKAVEQLQPADVAPVKCLGEVPYDFIRKRLTIGVAKNSGNLLICKGAFNTVIEICEQVRLNDGSIADIAAYREQLLSQCAHYGDSGMRVIAICYKTFADVPVTVALESRMIFAGFILLKDPVKAEMQDTLHRLKQLHVDLKIITGDNRNIARSAAIQLGIKEPVVMTGETLLQTSPEALVHLARKVHIFAEVEPQQKERIILALKQHHTVAYMGDGINDVAAIHAADAGISVNNAVDVAREAADFVLLEKNLMVIAEGIQEGRKTFANTLKYIFINTGSTFGNMISVAAASVFLPFLPMLPKQILMTNFLTDFPFLSVSTDRVDREQHERPGKWNLRMVRRYMVVFGLHSTLFDLLTFFTLTKLLQASAGTFQTGWFVESVLTELFILFIIRTRRAFYKSRPGQLLLILSSIALLLTISLPYLPVASAFGLMPLPPVILALMTGLALTYMLTAELLKHWFFKNYRKRFLKISLNSRST